jgi:hypothetical protein
MYTGICEIHIYNKRFKFFYFLYASFDALTDPVFDDPRVVTLNI